MTLEKEAYLIVPKVATEGMVEEGFDAADDHFAIDGDKGPWLRGAGYEATWQAMAAAAPPYEITEDDVEAGAKALRNKVAEIEVESAGKATVDPMVHSDEFARAVLIQFVKRLSGEE